MPAARATVSARDSSGRCSMAYLLSESAPTSQRETARYGRSLPHRRTPCSTCSSFFGGSTVLNGTTNTTNNGNVTQIVINTSQQSAPVTSFTQTYAYDTMNRIISASDTGPWTQTFNYDQFGNMWSPSYSGLPLQSTPSLQSAYTAATNQLAVGSSYDAAGNQPVFAGSNLTYDAENRQLTATNSGSGAVVTYAYDGLGLRVSKSSSATGITTTYVHDAFGNLAVEYNPPATSPCTTCYLSWDHLGSTRMVTDASVIPVTGQNALRHDYVPFGVEIPAGYAGRTASWGVSDGLTPKFTGQDRDTDTGLDFFQARYMGTPQGRFTSPDPAGNSVADPSNPQSWNMYSYVWNNPLALVDPSGLDPSGNDGCTSLSDSGCDDSDLFNLNGAWWGPDQSLPPPPYVPPPPTPVPSPTTGPYGNQGGSSTPCGGQGGGVQGNSAFPDTPTGCPVHPPLLTVGPTFSAPGRNPKVIKGPTISASAPPRVSDFVPLVTCLFAPHDFVQLVYGPRGPKTDRSSCR